MNSTVKKMTTFFSTKLIYPKKKKKHQAKDPPGKETKNKTHKQDIIKKSSFKNKKIKTHQPLQTKKPGKKSRNAGQSRKRT